MKLYYFNPNTYGAEAFVCAESKEQAKEYLSKTRKKEGESPDNIDCILNQLRNEALDNMLNLVGKYTLDEFEPGKVVFAEIS